MAQPLLVYDGDCGFCSSWAAWVAVRGVETQPWQRLTLAAVGLTQTDVERSAWWIGADGARVGGHRAIGCALAATHGPAAFLGWLLLRPPLGWIGALGYPVVSRFRHRLPGGTPACRT